MAQVYSLVCWGGSSGFTSTMTIANPCVVTITNHGLNAGNGVIFTTTGALPSGIVSGTTYYALSTGANTFNLYDTAAHAIAGGSTGMVVTTGSQSGTHTCKSAYYVGLGSYTRWGAKIYGSVAAWYAARTSAGVNLYDTEVCEIGDSFTETISATINITLACASVIITTLVNGVRSPGFHGGVVGRGYTISPNSTWIVCFSNTTWNTTFDGLYLYLPYGGDSAISTGAPYTTVSNNICNTAGGGSIIGFDISSQIGTIYNNLAINCSTYGFRINTYLEFNILYNNMAINGGTGFFGSTARGFYYNNISFGNTLNWGTGLNPNGAAYNFGVSGDTPWNLGTSTAVTNLVSGDFANYASLNLAPASSSSHQVETGMVVYQGTLSDITGALRPNYDPATYPTTLWCGGAYEFNHGNGLPPQTVSLNFSGLLNGSQLYVYPTVGGSSIINTTISGTTYSTTYTYTGDVAVTIRVRLAGYQEWTTTGTITTNGLSLTVGQSADGTY